MSAPNTRRTEVIESISPAGFEKYVEELTELVHDVDGDSDCESSIANLGARYGLTFHIELVPDLLKRQA
jgi:hypothetical protein